MMKVVAIIQARMGSTRLPGKVMLPLAGKPVIGHVVDRVRRIAKVDEVIVATSTLSAEQPMIDYLSTRNDATVFRGSESDVLSRYYTAALQAQADIVIRITADCPLLSVQVSSAVLKYMLDRVDSCDYVSNTITRTYPRGLDTEVFSFAALEDAYNEAIVQAEREHVTPYIWQHPERSRICNVADANDHSDLRWTVDTTEDFELINLICKTLCPGNPLFDYTDILKLLDTNPDWSLINSQVSQKGVE